MTRPGRAAPRRRVRRVRRVAWHGVVTFSVVCTAAAALAEDDPAPRDHAFVETAVPRTTFFVGEPIPLTLRVGVDGAWFREHVIQPYLRQLAVPVHVHAPWVAGLPGLAVQPGERSAAASGARVTLAFDDAVVEAVKAGERAAGGRTFTLYEVTRTLLAARPGEVVVPAPALAFSYAARFDEDVVQGRVPVGRRDTVVDGRPITLTVRALPAEGRHPGFSGAVGTFRVTAEAAPTDLRAGDGFKLTLRITGDGNLATFDTPRLGDLPELAHFHVLGVLDDRGWNPAAGRTIAYDIATLDAEPHEVPALPFAYFDPAEPAGYRVARTEPIPLRVRPVPAVPGAAPAPGATQRPAPDGAESPGASRVWLVPVAVAGIAVVLWTNRRRRRRATPAELRARAAAETFRRDAAAPGADLSEAFAEYLAARLGCARAAVIGPDLAARLAAAGAPSAVASRAAALLERLVAERYAGSAAQRGTPGPGGRDELLREALTCVDALEAVFTSGSAGR